MHARRIALTLGALLLSLALAGSAGAAPQVEVEYDLSGTSFDGFVPWTFLKNVPTDEPGNPVSISLGSMKVVYQSDATASDATIRTGPATIESLKLGWSGSLFRGAISRFALRAPASTPAGIRFRT